MCTLVAKNSVLQVTNHCVLLLTDYKSPILGFIYNGLGQSYMLKGDFKNALLNLEKALDIANTSNFFDLKIEVYKSFQDYYKARNDNDSYILYNEKREELTLMDEQNRKEIANQLLQILEEKRLEMQIEHRNNIILLLGTSLLILIIMVWVFLYRNKKSQKNTKNRILKNNGKAKIESQSRIIEQGTYMPKESENYILGKLERFEYSKEFLDKGTSLTTLAAKIQTNTRYLSYVIKEHKQTDFTTYVNELRISYIIDCLERDPDFLQYKISYLADKCGFSSHTRFSVTFKKITGTTPSSFIESLKHSATDKIGIE
ncbi:helix-turn-helix transcriptional regulator [Arenibacter sp. 6A1]|uniref:response regulator transcription factor n=1 Tax=Arenibacter sp. 6A1 TaxID=2720391 RepID=UPI001447F9D9|nr:response regulator transcription factor [Arenibacter sp. 6A1]NKI28411.1 helix-turn-helix transcriptional regulator [Arenibacter sp. 6A1]